MHSQRHQADVFPTPGAAPALAPFSRQKYPPVRSTARRLRGAELRVDVAKAATRRLIAEGAGWRAACCAIQLSARCRSIHSAAPAVPRGAPAKGKAGGKKIIH